ncbi:anti-phage ZorAB system protein ZorA [Nitrospira moscoviensis]|uniref:Putative membrane protein n=1 Tax=Nitrospira moscoviensis TaxID=42253 RepID=A0A0K2GFV9_NITMO|nr:anti-phage ZorAB system protein ZorA [Nitrospira moscoviensis]ALA59739.1 putative membrane protein [Nitrospira moscoviensis]
MKVLLGHPQHVYAVGGLLVLSVCLFLTLFLLPGLRQALRLRRLIAGLHALENKHAAGLDSLFHDDKVLKHLWSEFKETLHAQKELNPCSGQFEVVAERSTIPAQAFFSTETLVDTVIRTEFFKHLPGILTGLGIIGTFFGLIHGLKAFEVSDNPAIAKQSLNALLQGVHEAFLVSAAAICLAMLVTFVEKWLITALHKRVETICQLLDGMFQAGAGEEYLSRLVQASEASAKEAKQLKQSLVGDLKQILEDLTEKQITANSLNSNQIADRIVSGVNDSLKEPLTNISQAVKHVTGSQGEAVNRLLTDTMAALTAQLRDLFGQQITGINQMQQQTIDAMASAVGKLEQLVADIATTGAQTTTSMTDKLNSAIAAIEGRQAAMDAQVQSLISQITTHVDLSQTETNHKLREAVSAMSQELASTVGNLREMVNSASQQDAERHRMLEQGTTTAVSAISAEVRTILEQSAVSAQTMHNAVAAMERITTDSINRMSLSADRLYGASEKFAQAGNATTNILDRAQALLKQMADASGALTGSATVLNAAINDYKATRDSLASMITALSESVESAKREASLTADIVSRIERSAAVLREAEGEAEKYLEEVTKVLVEAHAAFGSQITSTLDKVNGDFHAHVQRATGALAGAIEDLEGVFDRLPGN